MVPEAIGTRQVSAPGVNLSRSRPGLPLRAPEIGRKEQAWESPDALGDGVNNRSSYSVLAGAHSQVGGVSQIADNFILGVRDEVVTPPTAKLPPVPTPLPPAAFRAST